jgi:type 1 glutamine amidotransferase
MLALVAATLIGPQSSSQTLSALPFPNPRVLIFTKTKGFRHDSIETAVQALKQEGASQGYSVTATEDASVFTDTNLTKFDVVAFVLTTGDVLNDTQQKALENFVNQGKGWVGVHSASDTEYEWPWYADLVGAYFKSHPPGGQKLHVQVENRGNLSSWNLPGYWFRADEWYDWRANPRGNVTVLASIDESQYKKPPYQDHPISWFHHVGKGRAWYTEMGHYKDCYQEPAFLGHLSGGIIWAAQGQKPTGVKDVAWTSARGWRPVDGGLENDPKTGAALVGKENHGDIYLHAEFRIPKGSNSGVYFQGRYEIQILDSWGVSKKDLKFSDCGAVYQQFDEKTQKGWDGNPPAVNAFAGPNVWNSYDVLFRAPRFKGKQKISNAKFVEVRLNGVVIHENVEVTGPTRAAMFGDEKATGPLMLQGDHGPVAYRNVWTKPVRL